MRTFLICVICMSSLNLINGSVVPGTRTVAQTKATRDTAMNLNGFLTSLTKGEIISNSPVTKALDDFVSKIVPAHCERLQNIQEDFLRTYFSKLKGDSSSNQIIKAFEELVTVTMPAVCGQSATKGLVTSSLKTNNIIDNLNKLIDWVKSTNDNSKKVN